MSPSTTNKNGRCPSHPPIPTAKNAERERSRVRSLRSAFQSLQACLPSVPPDTKLSKLDILILATNYIAQLMATLGDQPSQEEINSNSGRDLIVSMDQSSFPVTIPTSSSLQSTYYHPMKKWPMRSRLYSLVQLAATTEKEMMGVSSSLTTNTSSKMETPSEESDFNNNESSSMTFEQHDHQTFTCSTDDMTSLHFPLDLDEAMINR